MTNQKYAAIEGYEQARKRLEECEARVKEIFEALERILGLYRQGSLTTQGNELQERKVSGGIGVVARIEYPELPDVASAVADLERAKEQEESSRRRAISAGSDSDFLRHL